MLQHGHNRALFVACNFSPLLRKDRKRQYDRHTEGASCHSLKPLQHLLPSRQPPAACSPSAGSVSRCSASEKADRRDLSRNSRRFTGFVASSRRLKQSLSFQKSFVPKNFLERYADPDAAPPNDAAFLFHAAVEQFESIRQRHHRKDFKASAAPRIVDQPAGDHRLLGTRDDLRLRRVRGTRPNALIESLRFGILRHHPRMLVVPGYGIVKWRRTVSGNLKPGNLNQKGEPNAASRASLSLGQ